MYLFLISAATQAGPRQAQAHQATQETQNVPVSNTRPYTSRPQTSPRQAQAAQAAQSPNMYLFLIPGATQASPRKAQAAQAAPEPQNVPVSNTRRYRGRPQKGPGRPCAGPDGTRAKPGLGGVPPVLPPVLAPTELGQNRASGGTPSFAPVLAPTELGQNRASGGYPRFCPLCWPRRN